MGFFSWNCKACGHPLLSEWAINDINAWMNDVVVILKNNEVVTGNYDGYGNVDGHDVVRGDFELSSQECYHRSCYDVCDQPQTFTSPSENAEDQGFFYDDGDHDRVDPAEMPEMVLYQPGKMHLVSIFKTKSEHKPDILRLLAEYPKSQIMSYDEAVIQIRQLADATCGRWKQITEENYDMALECLPPLGMVSTDPYTLFRCAERSTQDIRTVYVCKKSEPKTFFSADYRDEVKNEDIIDQLMSHLELEEQSKVS